MTRDSRVAGHRDGHTQDLALQASGPLLPSPASLPLSARGHRPSCTVSTGFAQSAAPVGKVFHGPALLGHAQEVPVAITW